MATGPNICSICHEVFRTPEFAARCQAQGRPPLLYHVGELLLKKSAPDHLLLVTASMVHHGTAKCPVNGPCEHAVSYAGSRLYSGYKDLNRVWFASLSAFGCGWQSIMPGHERIATLNFPGSYPWGEISEKGPPDIYLASPRPEEDWRRLWEVWDAMQPKTRGRPRKDRQLPLLKKEE